MRRCDSAAEVCERLARRMEWQMAAESPEGPGSGIPGEKNAYAAQFEEGFSSDQVKQCKRTSFFSFSYIHLYIYIV